MAKKIIKAKGDEAMRREAEVSAMPQFIDQEINPQSTIIQILVFSNQPTLLEKAERIFHRDMSSQLIHCIRAHGVVVAYLRPLNLFNPSECLSFYHYHLDRSLQGRAAIYLTTQSSEGGTR